MQTFLPHPSFHRSAAALDDRRLGKQRVEVLQILRALHLEDYGWGSHPAVLMWRGCTRALVAYGLAVVDEWLERGHTDSTRPNIAEFTRPQAALGACQLPAAELPPWLGWTALHRSHRAALVRKDPLVYGAAFPDVRTDEPYVWPEPPAGPPPQRPFSAWVVRAATGAVLGGFLERGYVGVPAGFGTAGATRKQRRQLQRLRHDVTVGDRVVLAAGDELQLALVDGPPAERTVAGNAHLTRAVVWDRTVPRAALLRPYQLQDPQALFTLRGESAVAAGGEPASGGRARR